MSTDKQEDRVSNSPQVDRRSFIKTTGVAATAVAGGIEGILAARRAPAFAQGTKLHWVRWVDFIPESDVELKRQMPEASKALGAECVLETINANDLQARITAAIQSGAGADIFNFQYNWAHLYQNAVSDVSDVAADLGRAHDGAAEDVGYGRRQRGTHGARALDGGHQCAADGVDGSVQDLTGALD